MTVPPFENRQIPGRILLVQEPSVLREMQQLLLRAAGYEVSVCSEPHEAFADLALDPFDIVVLNSLRPGADGAEYLLALQRTRPTMTILVAPNLTAERREQLKKAEVTSILDRPASPQALTREVDRLMGETHPASPPPSYAMLPRAAAEATATRGRTSAA